MTHYTDKIEDAMCYPDRFENVARYAEEIVLNYQGVSLIDKEDSIIVKVITDIIAMESELIDVNATIEKEEDEYPES